MKTTLQQLVNNEIKLKYSSAQSMASLATYFDLEKSEVTLMSAQGGGADTTDGGRAGGMLEFYQGSIIEVMINLIPKDSIPSNSSLFLFSYHLDFASQQPKQAPGVKLWLGKSFSFFQVLYRRLLHRSWAMDVKQYRLQSLELNEMGEEDGIYPARFKQPTDETTIVPRISNDLNPQFASFPIPDRASMLELRFSLASASISPDQVLNIDLMMILNSGKKWSAILPISLPQQFLRTMTTISASPYRIDIDPARELVFNPVFLEFTRSDGQPVHLDDNFGEEIPFKAEHIREDCVRLRLKDDEGRTSGLGEPIYYLRFSDRLSGHILSCVVPVIVTSSKND